MRNIILFDASDVRENLLPMTFTRPVADLRVGILTIREKWEHVLDGAYSYLTVEQRTEKMREFEQLTDPGQPEVALTLVEDIPDAFMGDALESDNLTYVLHLYTDYYDKQRVSVAQEN